MANSEALTNAAGPSDPLAWMRHDWDQRARDNARHYIATGHHTWTDEAFFESGRTCVEQQVLSDMGNIVLGGGNRQLGKCAFWKLAAARPA